MASNPDIPVPCGRCKKNLATPGSLCKMCFYYEDLHTRGVMHPQFVNCTACVANLIQQAEQQADEQEQRHWSDEVEKQVGAEQLTTAVEETQTTTVQEAPATPQPPILKPAVSRGWFSWIW